MDQGNKTDASDSSDRESSDLQKLSDEELVKGILERGDNALREELYHRYAPFVYRRSVAVMRDVELAKDITHDVMIKMFLKLSSFSFRSPFSHWVHRITYNHCLNVLRKKQKWRKSDLSDLTSVEDEGQEAVREKELQELKLEKLERAMDCLSESERMLLWMHYRDGFSLKDIAQTAGLGLSAVKMRLKRSRDKLARFYEKDCHER